MRGTVVAFYQYLQVLVFYPAEPKSPVFISLWPSIEGIYSPNKNFSLLGEFRVLNKCG